MGQRPKAGIVAAGIVVAGIVGLFALALGGSMALGLDAQDRRVAAPTETAAPATDVARGRQRGAVKLHKGDCVRHEGPGTSGGLDVISCTAPHDGEVIGTYQVRGSRYPGAEALVAEAGTRCAALVPANLLTSDREDLSDEVIYPEPDGWAAGDHTVECLFRAGQPLTTPLSEL